MWPTDREQRLGEKHTRTMTGPTKLHVPLTSTHSIGVTDKAFVGVIFGLVSQRSALVVFAFLPNRALHLSGQYSLQAYHNSPASQ